MVDPCLKKFDEEWVNAESLVDKAIVLYQHIHYVKLRYRGVGKLSEQIGPKLAFLEEHVQESTGKDFLKIQRVIADGRRTIADIGSKYGSGFKRKPSARERASISKAYPAICLFPGTDLEPENNPDTDVSHDIRDLDLGDGAA